MTNWASLYAANVLTWRRTIQVGCTCVTLAAAFFALHVGFDSSIESWFVASDPDRVTYEQFREQFGRDEIICVAFVHDDLLSPSTLTTISECCQALRRLPHVDSVLSLTTAESLVLEDGRLRLRKLVPEPYGELPDSEEIRRSIRSHPLFGNSILSRQGDAASIVIFPSDQCARVEDHVQLNRQVEDILRPLEQIGQLHFAGIPIINDAIVGFAKRDLMLLVPIVLVLVLGTTWMLLRDFVLAVIPLVVVAISIIWVVGAMGALGWNVNLLTSSLILSVMVIGVATSIHILCAWLDERSDCSSSSEAIRRALGWVLLPCAMTSVSTCVGFLALTATKMQPIGRFGLLAAFGTLSAFVLNATFVPVVLANIPNVDVNRPRTSVHSDGLYRLLRWLGSPTRSSSRAVICVSLLALLPFTWAICQLRPTADPLLFFRSDAKVRIDTESVDSLFQGSASFEFLVSSPKAGFSRKETLERMIDFQAWLSDQLPVGETMSIADLVIEAERVRLEKPVGRIPDKNIYAAYLTFRRLAPETLNDWLSDEFNIGRISARVPLTRTNELAENVPILEAEISKRFPDQKLRVRTTGHFKLVNNMLRYLLFSQIQGLTLACVGTTLMMCWLLGSWRLGLLSMVPNLIPVAAGLALMGFYGIGLDPGTVMIGPVALGLVVDDSCHFLASFRRYHKQGDSARDAIATTMLHTGRPIMATSLILVAGFLPMAAGKFVPSIYFGLITSVIVIVALLADLVLLPAVLRVIYAREPSAPIEKDRDMTRTGRPG